MTDYQLKAWRWLVINAELALETGCPMGEDEAILAADKRIKELERAILSNCYDDSSAAGKRLMALVIDS